MSTALVGMRRIDEAQLPAHYEAAKRELAECLEVDECASWADKAAALASYARQVKDEELEKHAIRIKDRAVRRCGELLGEIPPHPGGRKPTGTSRYVSRSQAAADAGLSPDQKDQALQVANVPAEDFEEAVESDAPPTLTELAELGTKKKPAPLVDLQGRDPKEFNRSLHINGAVRQLREFIGETTPEEFVRGGLPRHYEEFKENSQPLMAWLKRVSALLKEHK